MTQQVTLNLPLHNVPGGEIVATDVTRENYMAEYAGNYFEWVKGYVIKVGAINLHHYGITEYLTMLFNAYFHNNPVGRLLGAGFIMRMDEQETYRKPDLQIVLADNYPNLADLAMVGASDIVIEVVLPESTAVDYGEKFVEYQNARVSEYWLIDLQREEVQFYRLNKLNVFKNVSPGHEGLYKTPLLPKFTFDTRALWRKELPDFFAVGQNVHMMMRDG